MPLSVFGQVHKKIKIVNGITHKPVKGVYFYIVKNKDEQVSIGETNRKGTYTAILFNTDTTATYRITTEKDEFKSVKKEINLFDNKKLTIEVYPDSSFRPNDPTLTYSVCSSIYFGSYLPKEPQSIDDLPDSIRTRLVAHLIARLGNNFYSKLKLSGGQILNLDRLYQVEENAKSYQWTPYPYYLCFSFQDPAKGIGLYTAKIVLDKYGNIIEEIELPNIKDNPGKENIISLKEASSIAAKNKFNPEVARVELGYDKINDSLFWSFCISDNGFNNSIMEIDAHSGAIIETYIQSVVR